ncbi:hypothetical protein KFK09_010632 [Dendrobium nobile]|uniref:Uncharacterized protein n=1 Tax=Dendrobium nobile TaxID=94219 RepID=A0A8T3BAG0_DENNO|nr:hypothetical protein KFK09_010632 [Dendrobium nobile]
MLIISVMPHVCIKEMEMRLVWFKVVQSPNMLRLIYCGVFGIIVMRRSIW